MAGSQGEKKNWEDWVGGGVSAFALGGFVLAIIVAFCFAFRAYGDWRTFWNFLRVHHEVVRNVSFGVAGAFAGLTGLYALYNSTRRTVHIRREADTSVGRRVIEQDRAAFERIARVLELLGNEQVSTRLGAIHVLIDLTELPNVSPTTRTMVQSVFEAYLEDWSSREDKARRTEKDLETITDYLLSTTGMRER